MVAGECREERAVTKKIVPSGTGKELPAVRPLARLRVLGGERTRSGGQARPGRERVKPLRGEGVSTGRGLAQRGGYGPLAAAKLSDDGPSILRMTLLHHGEGARPRRPMSGASHPGCGTQTQTTKAERKRSNLGSDGEVREGVRWVNVQKGAQAPPKAAVVGGRFEPQNDRISRWLLRAAWFGVPVVLAACWLFWLFASARFVPYGTTGDAASIVIATLAALLPWTLAGIVMC